MLKTFTIEFFRGSLIRDEGRNVSDVLNILSTQDSLPNKKIDGYSYAIRELQSFRNNTYRGIFCKYRTDDIPHIATLDGQNERDIDLDENEALVEKNHFVYHKANEILVFQSNRNAGSHRTLGTYLGDLENEIITFDYVLQLDAVERLLHHDVDPKNLELRFAQPGDEYIRDQNPRFDAALMDLLNETGGAKINIKIMATGRSALRNIVKTHIPRLISRYPESVKAAKFTVMEDGIRHPIDLIADRLTTKKDVSMDGRYPNSTEMFRALNDARDEHDDMLREVFRD